MIVADTDVLIDFLRNCNPAADRVAYELEAGSLATTAITRFELLCGARTHREEKTVLELLDAMALLSLNQQAADRAAKVRKTLKVKRMDIGRGDCLIAGIVLENSGILLTRNTHHFEHVEGLHLSRLAATPMRRNRGIDFPVGTIPFA